MPAYPVHITVSLRKGVTVESLGVARELIATRVIVTVANSAQEAERKIMLYMMSVLGVAFHSVVVTVDASADKASSTQPGTRTRVGSWPQRIWSFCKGIF